jgi:hypothetical protein
MIYLYRGNIKKLFIWGEPTRVYPRTGPVEARSRLCYYFPLNFILSLNIGIKLAHLREIRLRLTTQYLGWTGWEFPHIRPGLARLSGRVLLLCSRENIDLNKIFGLISILKRLRLQVIFVKVCREFQVRKNIYIYLYYTV